MRKRKRKEDEKTLEELNSAHRRSQAKCQLIQTSYIKRIKLFLFWPYNKHLVNRAKSLCMGESGPRSGVQTSLRSFCTYDWSFGQDSPIQTSCSVNKYGLLTVCSVKMAGYWPRSFFLRVYGPRRKERGQYPAILTAQTWSIKDLLYGFWGNFACGIQRVVPSRQDGSIMPALVANHSARFGSSCPLVELTI